MGFGPFGPQGRANINELWDSMRILLCEQSVRCRFEPGPCQTLGTASVSGATKPPSSSPSPPGEGTWLPFMGMYLAESQVPYYAKVQSALFERPSFRMASADLNFRGSPASGSGFEWQPHKLLCPGYRAIRSAARAPMDATPHATGYHWCRCTPAG